MNVEICQNCNACPYLGLYYSIKDKKFIAHNEMNCLKSDGVISVADDVDEEIFNRVAKYLTVERKDKDLTWYLLDLESIKNNEIVKKITINHNCPYHLKHQLYDWNK